MPQAPPSDAASSRSPKRIATASQRGGAEADGARGSEDYAQLLAEVRGVGLKITPQRLAIIRELAGDLSHPTAQELFDRLRAELPSMSFATVYNTLSALTSAGLCVSRSLSRGPARFDPNTAVHDHAVCDGCGRVTDVPRAPSNAVPMVTGFEVHAVECVYRGRCASCSGDNDGAHPLTAPAEAKLAQTKLAGTAPRN